jgi:protein-S-isoprenylcysteine O-methyltransferase Ste14
MSEKLPHEGLRVPPPLLFLATLVIGWLLQWLFPISVLPPGIVLLAAGVVVLALGILLLFWAVSMMRRAGTSPNPTQPTTAIVTTGPFRYTRNPIYLGFTLICVGIAIAANDVWVLLPLLVVLAIMTRVVIPSEERYLEQKFGSAYTDYTARVRRWL